MDKRYVQRKVGTPRASTVGNEHLGHQSVTGNRLLPFHLNHAYLRKAHRHPQVETTNVGQYLCTRRHILFCILGTKDGYRPN